MVTASTAFPTAIPRPERRVPWQERLSTGGAAALSILGIIGAMGIVVLALLAVPLAAVIVFGPALRALL